MLPADWNTVFSLLPVAAADWRPALAAPLPAAEAAGNLHNLADKLLIGLLGQLIDSLHRCSRLANGGTAAGGEPQRQQA